MGQTHNHHLFMTDYIREHKVIRIFMDRGLAINIMPKSMMNNLGITIEELFNNQTKIQGFNLKG